MRIIIWVLELCRLYIRNVRILIMSYLTLWCTKDIQQKYYKEIAQVGKINLSHERLIVQLVFKVNLLLQNITYFFFI